jgi:signal transduction histidine kinase
LAEGIIIRGDFVGYRILVVDDEKNMREFLSSALSMIGGFSVELAENGEEALRKITKDPFDLVLTDLKMPKMDGLQLINQILQVKPEILTVLMTGYGTIDTALEAIKGGASDFVMKPIDIDELIALLKRVLEERHRFVKLKDLADQLEKANQEVKKLDEMKLQFISLASHELRTPLTAVKSIIEFMLVGRAGKLTKAQKEYLCTSDVNINRLAKIINDILDLLHIHSGSIDMNFEDLDIAELVEFAVGCLKARAEEKSITVECKVLQGLPTVCADREKVVKILLNLIGNAIKFTSEHGEVSVSARLTEEGDGLEVMVKDSGIGIPQAQLEHLFEKFHHIEAPSQPIADGAGIGLAITKGLVDALNGKIWVESKVGEGSLFTFTLPLSREDRGYPLATSFRCNTAASPTMTRACGKRNA